MKLFTIGEILDPNIGVIVIRVSPNNDKNIFNFKKNKYEEDYNFISDAVIKMSDFYGSTFYNTLKSKELSRFYIVRTDVVQAISDIVVKDNKVVVFEILTGPSEKALLSAINVACNKPNGNNKSNGRYTKTTYRRTK